MSNRQSQSDQDFKAPGPHHSQNKMQSPGNYKGQKHFSPGSYQGDQNRSNNNQECNYDKAYTNSPGNGRDRGSWQGPRGRRRSGSGGRNGESFPSGGSPSGRDRSRDRQDNGSDYRQSHKRSGSWGRQGNQYGSPSQQTDGQWGQQWGSQYQRGYQNYGHDNSYYDGEHSGYGRGRRNWDNQNSPDKGGRGRGWRQNSAGFSSDGMTPDKNRYGRDDSDVFLSKTLSSILRHNAERFGFKLMKGGYLYVDDILHRVHKLHGYTLEDVRRIVDSNDKKRFALDEDNGRVKIRANQGHSLEVEDLDLQPILSADEVPVVVHGTYYSSWEFIKKSGLHRMNRNHIHFAAGEPGENGVISGMRKTCEVMIYIDMEKALKDGLKFFRSANNVILCAGDKDGYINPCYFLGVLDRVNKHRLELGNITAASTSDEKPKEGKKRKKKNKGNKQQESANATESKEEVIDEVKSKESEDGATTDDSSLPMTKKQHVNDSESWENPEANISVEEGAAASRNKDNELETDEVKSKHWNVPHVVKDEADSTAIVENLCSIAPEHIAICCVGENLGTESSRIRAIVITAQPDSYIYHLPDENTSLVKDGNLDKLLLNKEINKVFHDIGAVSTSLINEFDILMDGAPIWDITMLYNKVPKMDMHELNFFKEETFKEWTRQNEEFGKRMASHFDEAVVGQLVERGKLIWDLHGVCFKQLDTLISKALRKEIFQAAIPSTDNFLSEKIERLKLEKRGKKGKKQSEVAEEKPQQQPQKPKKKKGKK